MHDIAAPSPAKSSPALRASVSHIGKKSTVLMPDAHDPLSATNIQSHPIRLDAPFLFDVERESGMMPARSIGLANERIAVLSRNFSGWEPW